MGYYGILYQNSNKKKKTRWSVSRILLLKKYYGYSSRDNCYQSLLCVLPGKTQSKVVKRLCLLRLAPNGVYPAINVTINAVSSYLTISTLPKGGIFSVALSLRSPSPGVTRHCYSVESGLSSFKGSHTTI